MLRRSGVESPGCSRNCSCGYLGQRHLYARKNQAFLINCSLNFLVTPQSSHSRPWQRRLRERLRAQLNHA